MHGNGSFSGEAFFFKDMFYLVMNIEVEPYSIDF